MKISGLLPAILVCLLPVCASAQTAPGKWAITDNSFLIEEAFNQERDVFQNIFTWVRGQQGGWQGAFTQSGPREPDGPVF